MNGITVSANTQAALSPVALFLHADIVVKIVMIGLLLASLWTWTIIFGRGGEEALTLVDHGIAFRIVPGITAGIGGLAYAGIPLTHRDHASAVSFVAGQCKGLADQNWSGLAGKGRTLVIYMGVATCPDIADKLMADGVAPDMPVAVLERGTLVGHRAIKTLLADLGPMVEREKVQSPAIIVVGEVVELSDAEDKLARWARIAEAAA